MRPLTYALAAFACVSAQPNFTPLNWRWYLNSPCPYAADPVASVAAALAGSLAGQREAVRSILAEVQAWVDDFEQGAPTRPLVLMITGSTGLGKSDSALAVARALLAPQAAWLPGAAPALPEGLLELSGVRFGGGGNVTRLREELRGALAQALYDCSGHAVVVFDEVQKVDKRVLSELLPVMQGAESRVYHSAFGGGVKPLDASRMVVMLVSDAGLQVLEGGAAGGAAGARERLARNLVKALDMEFLESGFPLGTLVQSIVPFANLVGADVPGVVAHHLAHARLPAKLREAADDLLVSPSALTALSTMAYVPYTTWITTWDPEQNETEPQRMHVDTCMRDAAREEREWERRAAAAAAAQREAPIGVDGSAGSSSSSSAPEGGPSLCGAPCGVPLSCEAERGARSVMYNSASPVKRMLKLLGSFGKVGALLKARPSPEELRLAFKGLPEVRTSREVAAAAEAAGGAKAREPSLRVELRVSAACGLPSVRTAGMCTAAGLPGAGLRVQRCVLVADCPGCGALKELKKYCPAWTGPGECCETLFEGELPP